MCLCFFFFFFFFSSRRRHTRLTCDWSSDVCSSDLDFATANEWKSQVVHQMTQGVASLFKANGVEWVKGTGRFRDAHTISLEGGEDVTFKSAIIATGSFPLWPPIDGLDSPRCVDSEALLAQ